MKAKKSLILVVVLLALLSVGPVSLISACEGTITVRKFHDVNGDGVQNGGEESIEGWLIRVYGWDKAANMFLIGEGPTGPNGTVTFSSDIPVSKVTVWEEERECWKPTTPLGMNRWDGGYYVEFSLPSFPDVVEFGNVKTCEPPCQTDLIAGQDWDSPAGVVTVYDDGQFLYVTFDTTGWSLGETHLYVGITPPKKSAPGSFPYSNQTGYYTIPLSDFGGNDTLYIAAHAVVTQGEQQETAWADTYGIPIRNKGWAMYFGYTVGAGCFDPSLEH